MHPEPKPGTGVLIFSVKYKNSERAPSGIHPIMNLNSSDAIAIRDGHSNRKPY